MDILNLTNYETLNVQETREAIYITARLIQPPQACQKCGVKRLNNLVKYGRKEQVFVDAPVRMKPVFLYIQRQRYKCHDCGETFWQELPDISENHAITNRAVELIERSCLHHTFVDIANQFCINEKTVRLIAKDFLRMLENNYIRHAPIWMGMDEIYIRSKKRFVLTDIMHHRLIDMLPDNSLPTLRQYFTNLRSLGRVEYVTMDMWSGYKTLCKEIIPHAHVIVDKYHVVRGANHALQAVRVRIGGHLSIAEKRKLMRSQNLLNSRQDLSEKQSARLNHYFEQFPMLYNAYCCKEFFYYIYEAETRDEAVKRFKEWKDTITPDIKFAFKPLAKRIDKWHKEVFNYFDCPNRLTNAYTESFNNLIRKINRDGRGYSFEILRAKMLFAKRYAQENKLVDKYGRPEPLMTCKVDPPFYGEEFSTLIQLLEDGKR